MENKKNNALISTSNTSSVKLYSKNSEPYSIHKYVHGTKRIEYFVFRTRRRKTSEIVVDSDEIVIRVPYSKPLSEIEALIKEKISWILKKQKDLLENERNIEILKPGYSEESTLPYLGKNYNIDIKILDLQKEKLVEEQKNSIVYKNGRFLFTIHSYMNNSQNYNEVIKALHDDWLYHKAEIIFKEKIEILGKIVNVKPNKIVIKNLKNRWGSITKNNNINLNINLIKAPTHVIDYIILHELCHFKIKGHSFRFWNLLKRYFPDYPKYVDWLNINGKNLLD
jgi:predicted metal-dependent hydrolase